MIILKAGGTFPDLARSHGDFEHWILRGLRRPAEAVRVLDAREAPELPHAERCQGLIITGSHAMVTDLAPWGVRIADWLPSLVEADVPILGICYGHQLLAQALGGRVDYHPKGAEIGTVTLTLTAEAGSDPLFRALPSEFAAHSTHSQTVTSLPLGAVRLAGNAFEPNHAFRVGRRAWGVQFHPEFDRAIMACYIEQQLSRLQAQGQDRAALLASIRDTPIGIQLLRAFADLVFAPR
jgi:GMP synthase (glutamine-hydrolysing)